MIIIGIDPGPDSSGLVRWDARGERVVEAGHYDNEDILRRLPEWFGYQRNHLVCEWIELYKTAAVGQAIFHTCRQVGRLQHAWETRYGVFHLMLRREAMSHLCRASTAKDKDVRMALLERFSGGRKGTKKAPQPLDMVSGHAWSALALAVAWADIHGEIIND